MRRSHRTFVVGALALGAFAVATIACPAQVPRASAAGTRYVDQVFTTSATTRDVVYATAPALVTGLPTDLLLDVHEPSGDVLESRPALITIHGGGFRAGSRSQLTWPAEWARRGYVVFNIDYRLDPDNRCQDVQDGKVPVGDIAAEAARCQAAIDAAQHDAQAAVRWVRAHAAAFRVDPARIGAMGGSAGAITAINVAYRADDPGDVGDLDGIDSSIGVALAMSGCSYDLPAIGPGDAPVAMIHAELDQAVPFACALETAATARASGLVAETMLWYGESTHAQALYTKYQSVIDPVWTRFVVEHLGLDAVPAGSSSVIHGEANRSAIVSLVATESGGAGWLQALSCGAVPGSTSNLNTDGAGQIRAGLAVVRFDAAGAACIHNSMPTHVVADLQGYLAAGTFDDVDDRRLLDTRGGAPVAAGTAVVVHGEPDRSAVVSLVATDTAGPGWLQVLPCGVTPGSTSNLDVDAAGQIRAALAIVRFDANGEACVFTTVASHVVVDLQGWFDAAAFDDVDDARLLDTRALGGRLPAGGRAVIHGRPGGSAFVSLVSTEGAAAGWLQVLACDAAPGSTSNLDTDRAGQIIAAATVARFDADGEACIYSSFETHVVVDLQGWFTSGTFDDVDDVRLLDTRQHDA